MRLTSQLSNSISRVFPKLLKYFNRTIISASFILLPTGVCPVIFILDLNDSESLNSSFGSDMWYFYKLSNGFE